MRFSVLSAHPDSKLPLTVAKDAASDDLLPEYNKAAQQLVDLTNFKSVKINVDVVPKLAKKYQIKTKPTLKWIKNGQLLNHYCCYW